MCTRRRAVSFTGTLCCVVEGREADGDGFVGVEGRRCVLDEEDWTGAGSPGEAPANYPSCQAEFGFSFSRSRSQGLPRPVGSFC